jgi:hypothetical protein
MVTTSQAGQTSGRRPSPDVGLLVAGLLTAGMALYHFCLPYLWGWGEPLLKMPMLHWALFMLNASFSYLLLAGGVISVGLALAPRAHDRSGRWMLVAMAGYWLFNAVYQIVAPMPMPPRLALLRWGLFGFAAAVALLYVMALTRRARAIALAPVSRPSAVTGVRR